MSSLYCWLTIKAAAHTIFYIQNSTNLSEDLPMT